MSSVDKILSFLGFTRDSKMAQDKLTTIVTHRYERTEVLEKCLQGFGYKDYQIDDKNRPGIQIRLADGKKLTEDQVKKVHAAYRAEHKRKRTPKNAEDSE
ncbi:hypothetical protein LQW54_003694 [Pestalotiopsis sp. IQ-011]